MTIHEDRQWYRLQIKDVLAYGKQAHREHHHNIPLFIPKHTWHLYVYQSSTSNHSIAADKLTLGDSISLKKGDIVPATMRLISARGLRVQEQHVFGHSHEVRKNTFASKSLLPLSEQSNMVFPRSEVVSGTAIGIIVGLAQDFMKRHKHVVKKPSAKKLHSFLLQQTSARELQQIQRVVFDDLQRTSEIITLLQSVYLQKNIETIFFVKPDIVQELRRQQPELHVCRDVRQITPETKLLVVPDSEKSQVLHILAGQNKRLLYAYRGEERQRFSSIADKVLVFSKHASQVALFYADIIAPNIAAKEFSSILYNKK